jgi:hypothetical protein
LLTLTIPPQISEPFSRLVWIHYFFIFVIYIGWNISLLIVEKADKETKYFFIYFTIAEGFGLIIPSIMLVPSFSVFLGTILHVDITGYSVPLIVILSTYHLLIITTFVYVTYFMRLKRQTA